MGESFVCAVVSVVFVFKQFEKIKIQSMSGSEEREINKGRCSNLTE